MNNKIIKPRIIAFEVTQRCPLSCRHCRATASQDKTDFLTTGQCRKILKSVADFNKCVIILTGGEPMERPDIYDLTEYGRRLGLRMVMATCGYHITESAAAGLKKAGITAISFSLDGATAGTHDAFRQKPGAFQTVLSAIEKVRAAGIRFQINTTFTNLNITQAGEIANLAEKLGAYCFNPFILVPTGRGDEIRDLILAPDQYEKLLTDLAELKRKSKIEVRVTCGPQFARICRSRKIEDAEKVTGCLAATDFAFISTRGDVQTCGFLEISAGNLVENNFDFADIWLNSEFLNDLRDLSKYKGACSACAYLSVCRGCRARAYTMLGDYLQQDPICRLTLNTKKGKKKVAIALNKFQKKLCNIIQEPLPLRADPFAAIAERLKSDEATVIEQLQKLKAFGIIRSFRATVNCRSLGKVATLVTAHIPANDLVAVAAVINAMPGVSHNYLRDHNFNLWFTLQADNNEQIEKLLANLSHRLGCEFHSLPATKVFKLHVRFDPDLAEENLSVPEIQNDTYETVNLDSVPAHLTELEKDILTKLQKDLEISPRPFDFLVPDTVDIETALETIQSLTDKGVIRSVAAVLNYRKLGFAANVMFCARVKSDIVDYVGQKLAGLKIVSHCYERKTFRGWPYNIYAMMHARTDGQIRRVINEITASEKIEEFQLLATTEELKKKPVKQSFP